MADLGDLVPGGHAGADSLCSGDGLAWRLQERGCQPGRGGFCQVSQMCVLADVAREDTPGRTRCWLSVSSWLGRPGAYGIAVARARTERPLPRRPNGHSGAPLLLQLAHESLHAFTCGCERQLSAAFLRMT